MSDAFPETAPNVLIAIPTFNNRGALRGVVEKALATGLPVLVVNDGSTDGAEETLAGLAVARLDFSENQGKGAAILEAGRWAENRGFSHIITLDGDGQHNPSDVSRFLPKIAEKPWAIIVGCRDFNGSNIPGASRFGREWSNLWMRIVTGLRVLDSQSGFRAYPVGALTRIAYRSRRYDFEIETLIRSVWAGLGIDSVPVSVSYPPESERVSHFDKVRDNARISKVYTRAVFRTFLPWPHRVLFHTPASAERISLKHPLRSIRLLLLERTTPGEIALACMLGVFIGTLPIFGFHSPVILFLATVFRLNRLIAFNSQHVCMPPVVPVLCIQAGYYLRHGRFLTEISMQTLWHEAPWRLWEWFLGSLALAPTLALLAGGIAYLTTRLYQKRLRRERADAASAEEAKRFG